jgi:hypothetical protein
LRLADLQIVTLGFRRLRGPLGRFHRRVESIACAGRRVRVGGVALEQPAVEKTPSLTRRSSTANRRRWARQQRPYVTGSRSLQAQQHRRGRNELLFRALDHVDSPGTCNGNGNDLLSRRLWNCRSKRAMTEPFSGSPYTPIGSVCNCRGWLDFGGDSRRSR